MRESIDEVENFDTYNVLNSIIMPMPSKNNPPTNNIIPVEIKIVLLHLQYLLFFDVYAY